MNNESDQEWQTFLEHLKPEERASLEAFLEHWLTTADVAALLGLSRQGVLNQWQLPRCVIANNAFFPRSEVERLKTRTQARGNVHAGRPKQRKPTE